MAASIQPVAFSHYALIIRNVLLIFNFRTGKSFKFYPFDIVDWNAIQIRTENSLFEYCLPHVLRAYRCSATIHILYYVVYPAIWKLKVNNSEHCLDTCREQTNIGYANGERTTNHRNEILPVAKNDFVHKIQNCVCPFAFEFWVCLF